MSLNKKIYEATQQGKLKQPFTSEEMKEWFKNSGILKPDGTPYAVASLEAVLSNADISNSPTSNLNLKNLKSQINSDGKKKYWF